MREEVSENETVTGKITKTCEDTVVEKLVERVKVRDFVKAA